jgi:hypothetical protein
MKFCFMAKILFDIRWCMCVNGPGVVNLQVVFIFVTASVNENYDHIYSFFLIHSLLISCLSSAFRTELHTHTFAFLCSRIFLFILHNIRLIVCFQRVHHKKGGSLLFYTLNVPQFKTHTQFPNKQIDFHRLNWVRPTFLSNLTTISLWWELT